MAVLPKCMDKIVLSAYPETYITFKGIVLPPARTLQCDIRDGSYTDDFSLCFNKLTQNSLNNEIVSIRMGDWFKDLHCPNLTSLQIDEAVDIKDVAAIIKTHSQLQSLSLDISSGNFDFSKDLKAVLDSAAPVKPLNTTLKELHYIGYDDISPANQTAVQYLVLQLPALNCLGGFDVDFKQFIQNYLPQYPHLANIVVQ
ncbi:hypothetical protein IWW36_002871 [Coemansia brasiliensis]|uniref:Uncharacterized protein n=1 Tax=Coemansia brasiliensis TaxID=2650707 RepID=A0A9W8IF26_9FUNG|nr:hypothetical protein IWW36_002871 [Coemansia brasiliensis]